MNTTDKKMTVEVTEKEYREELAEGFTDDEVLKPGKYTVERSPWAEKLNGGKISQTGIKNYGRSKCKFRGY